MKNKQDGLNSMKDYTMKNVKNLETAIGNIQNQVQSGGNVYIKKKKECINDLYNKIKLLNRHVTGVQNEDERERDQNIYIYSKQ